MYVCVYLCMYVCIYDTNLNRQKMYINKQKEGKEKEK